MTQRQKTANEIREVGLIALNQALGQADTLRFLQLFNSGHGDYAKERHHILGNSSVKDLVLQLKARKRNKKS
jgi:hypothetical protein